MHSLWQLALSIVIVADVIVAIVQARRRAARLRREQQSYLDDLGDRRAWSGKGGPARSRRPGRVGVDGLWVRGGLPSATRYV